MHADATRVTHPAAMRASRAGMATCRSGPVPRRARLARHVPVACGLTNTVTISGWASRSRASRRSTQASISDAVIWSSNSRLSAATTWSAPYARSSPRWRAARPDPPTRSRGSTPVPAAGPARRSAGPCSPSPGRSPSRPGPGRCRSRRRHPVPALEQVRRGDAGELRCKADQGGGVLEQDREDGGSLLRRTASGSRARPCPRNSCSATHQHAPSNTSDEASTT